MASNCSKIFTKLKERNGNIKPYTPLDPEMTPQVIPPTVKVPDSVKTKIDLFYKFVNDERYFLLF